MNTRVVSFGPPAPADATKAASSAAPADAHVAGGGGNRGNRGKGRGNQPPSQANVDAANAAHAATSSVKQAAAPPALKPACKHGDKCHGCKICNKGSKGGSDQVAQLSSQLNDMQERYTALEGRLGKVEKDTSETKSGIQAILGYMQEDREQRKLSAPPQIPAIMPPSAAFHRSPSPQPKMKLVTSGPEGSIGQECGFWVPEWQSSGSTSARFSSGQNGWADMAGSGALVASSGSLPSPSSLQKPKKEALPSPSSLLKSGKESAGMSGSGLVRCNDASGFINMLTTNGWFSLLALLQSKGAEPSNHFLTAAVNAVALSQGKESNALAIACLDRARSVTAFEPNLRDHMRAAFDPENLAFKQFCIRMADYCSRSPDKGIEFRSVKYPYTYLAQNDQHRKELIAALRDS
jgi:hypothetical protein